MTEKDLKRRIEDLEDINHRIRLENRRLKWKLAKKTGQSADFVKHTLKVFEMCGVDWKDMVKLYDYCIEQEKLNDKRIRETS